MICGSVEFVLVSHCHYLMDVKSSAVETVSLEAKVWLGAYGNRKFEFVAIIELSGLGLFLYFPEMSFILYSGCLCKCLFAWIKNRAVQLLQQKKKRFFLYIGVLFLGWSGSTYLIYDPITWLD